MPGGDVAKADTTVCPGCKRVRDKIARGTVYLEGEALASRPDEVMRLIRREEEIEKSYNNCSRILGITSDGQKMVIRTANSLLAIHIAKQLKKTFKGRMQIYKNSPGHRPRSKQGEGTVAVTLMKVK